MMRPVIAAAALLAIAGSSYVYAQQRYEGRDGGPRAEQRQRLSPEDMAAFTDARIAALKAGLELTPDQAKNWPAFEQALRDMAQLRLQRMQARQAAAQPTQPQTPATAPASPFDRLANRADAMSKTSAALKHIADTGAPLYQSLNDAQKTRLTMLARFLRPHAMAERGWREGRGYGRDRGPGDRGDRGWMGRRYGENGPGWGGRRFEQQDERGPEGFSGGRMHRMMQGDDDSHL
jgi:hypothetical protein